MSTLNFAIIGCGGITLQNHLPGLAMCPEVKVTALCDADAGTLERARKQTGVEIASTNYAGMYAGNNINTFGGCLNPPIPGVRGTECPSHAGEQWGGMNYRGRRIAQMIDGPSNVPMVGEIFRGRAFYAFGNVSQQNGNRCRDWMEESGYCGADTSRPPNYYVQDEINWTEQYYPGLIGARSISSVHLGGAHALFGDGGVRFVGNSVDVQTWRNNGTCNGNEQVTLTF
jgi:hypothetical protein